MRLYADASVFGGCFDPEFAVESRRLFDEVSVARFVLIVSDALVAELQSAPERVRDVLEKLDREHIETVSLTPEASELCDAYMEAGIVGPASREDAEHIAIATVAGADLIVSWNFRHIVHFEKIAGYNAVNELHGYRSVRIFSPKEVVTP
ncbi:MAG: type II toxin-antitoxin system VapC family toxin [Verrucomicrobia bacterium]|nr:type II toxin-antitoxin system VapC family toxin [Verrucomicrobiota bacterium]